MTCSPARPADPCEMIAVLMTAPSEDVASSLGRTLVEEKLAACVNIVSSVRSIYHWEGRTCDDAEVLCIIKTRRSLFAPLSERVRSLHPYQVPEIVALDVLQASASYLAWLCESTRAQP